MIDVSVVIPLFNCERYILRAVESVLDQRHAALELIVVSDGSTDRSVDMLEPYRDRIVLVEQDNSGVAAARNRGMQAARGEFIAFLDADDWWYPSRLAAQLAAAERFREAGLLFSDFSVVDETGELRMKQGLREWYGVFRDASGTAWDRVYAKSDALQFVTPDGSHADARGFSGKVGEWLFAGNFINTSSVLLRKSCMERTGYFDTALSSEEDYDYWLRVAKIWELAYVDAVLVARRRRPGQLTDPARLEIVVRNVVTVVENSAGRMRPVVTAGMVRARLGRLHRTLGVICLRSGRNAEARRHLLTGARLQPSKFVGWALLALAAIPFNLLPHLERLNRRIRGRREPEFNSEVEHGL